MDKLKQSYSKAVYKLGNHGERTVEVLKEALSSVQGETESDIYGSGKLIEDFQRKMADFLGKEEAVFFPSGTMAQQIALRIWTDEKKSQAVAYHPLSHLEIHEEDGLKELHHIQPILIGSADRLITLNDIKELPESVACVLLELPQREIGGQLPSFKELEEIAQLCNEKGIRLHLDGARLWECLPYYGKDAAEICALFDSVYVSFYKGLGGIAGAVLAGKQPFIERAKIWKRRHGGDLISLYPYILSADYYFEKRIGNMAVYYNEAKAAAERFNHWPEIRTVPEVPVTNMFHVYFSKSLPEMAEILTEIQEKTEVGFTSMLKEQGAQSCSFELSLGDQYGAIPSEKLDAAFDLLRKKMTIMKKE